MDLQRLEALEQLGRLRDQKILSDAEFDTEKAKLLAAADAPVIVPRPAFFAGGLDRFRSRNAAIAAAVTAAVAVGAYFGLNSGLPAKPDKAAKATETTALASNGAATPVSLSSILKFKQPDECLPGDELKALLSDLRALEPDGASKTVTVGLSGPSLTPDVLRAEQGTAVIARLRAQGNLEGLRVTELRSTRFDGSETQAFQIRFAETPDRVRTRLNETGFAIPKDNDLKTVDLEDGHGLVYGIERVPEGTALTCATS